MVLKLLRYVILPLTVGRSTIHSAVELLNTWVETSSKFTALWSDSFSRKKLYFLFPRNVTSTANSLPGVANKFNACMPFCGQNSHQAWSLSSPGTTLGIVPACSRSVLLYPPKPSQTATEFV